MESPRQAELHNPDELEVAEDEGGAEASGAEPDRVEPVAAAPRVFSSARLAITHRCRTSRHERHAVTLNAPLARWKVGRKKAQSPEPQRRHLNVGGALSSAWPDCTDREVTRTERPPATCPRLCS